MSERDYTHRDLCSATSGLLNAFMNSNRDDLDEHTAKEIARAFEKKHDELGAETPTPDIEE